MTWEQAEAWAKQVLLAWGPLPSQAGVELEWAVTLAILEAFNEGVQFEREAQAIRQHEGRMAGRGL